MTTHTATLASSAAADVWHTLPEAAQRARRSEKAMRGLRARGQGPHFRKIDGRLMVSEADLQAWLRGEAEEGS